MELQAFFLKHFPIPTTQEPFLNIEVDRLIEIGILKKINNSQWAAPTFIINTALC